MINQYLIGRKGTVGNSQPRLITSLKILVYGILLFYLSTTTSHGQPRSHGGIRQARSYGYLPYRYLVSGLLDDQNELHKLSKARNYYSLKGDNQPLAMAVSGIQSRNRRANGNDIEDQLETILNEEVGPIDNVAEVYAPGSVGDDLSALYEKYMLGRLVGTHGDRQIIRASRTFRPWKGKRAAIF